VPGVRIHDVIVSIVLNEQLLGPDLSFQQFSGCQADLLDIMGRR
jgi:hypothetical protein